MKSRSKKGERRSTARATNGRGSRQSAGPGFVDKRGASLVQNSIMQRIDNSPKMTLQRLQVESSISEPAQRVEDEELLQGKFKALQRQGPEEEELMQGKFSTLQRQEAEEEELMQGKFSTLQRQGPEEEELMQGKFSTLQRQEAEEEELMQGKFRTLQRQGPEEEEPLQGKFSGTTQLEQEAAAAPNNSGLPHNLKSGIEALSGVNLSNVRVHYNSSRPAKVNALAYARGNDIHLGSGQEKHLPHEAWHTVQQRQGRVKPTLQIGGERINDDAGLEHEADVMGDKAVRYEK